MIQLIKILPGRWVKNWIMRLKNVLNKIYAIVCNLIDYSIIGAVKIARQGLKFAEWLSEMVSELMSYKINKNIKEGEVLASEEEFITCSFCGCVNRISPEEQKGRTPICGHCKNILTKPASQETPIIEAQFYNSRTSCESKIIKKSIILPCILLAILLILPFFRWDYVATKSFDRVVVKWKIDHWANQGWQESYGFNSFSETPEKPGTTNVNNAWKERNILTAYWQLAVFITVIYLLWVVFLFPWYKRKRETKRLKKSPIIYINIAQKVILILGAAVTVLVMAFILTEGIEYYTVAYVAAAALEVILFLIYIWVPTGVLYIVFKTNKKEKE